MTAGLWGGDREMTSSLYPSPPLSRVVLQVGCFRSSVAPSDPNCSFSFSGIPSLSFVLAAPPLSLLATGSSRPSEVLFLLFSYILVISSISYLCHLSNLQAPYSSGETSDIDNAGFPVRAAPATTRPTSILS